MRNFAIPYGYTPEQGTFPSYIDNRHLCTIGGTRSGKGATVIMQALLEVPHSVVVIDPKGQNAAVTAKARRAMGQQVKVVNPFGLHSRAPWHLPRHRYNPLAILGIDSETLVPDAAALAQALIVTKGRDPYFDDTARDLVTAVILYLVTTLGERATLAHVRKMVTDIAARDAQSEMLLRVMRQSPHAFVRQPIGRFGDAESKDISSATNSAITQLGFLDWPAMCDPAKGVLTGNDFSFAQLKKTPTTVYLIVPGQRMISLARFLRVMITQAIEAVISEPGGHPVLFILDEAARLENLDAVSGAYSYAAGFNCQLWPFYQNLKQIEETHGTGWSTVLANCGLVQFFTPADMETAEYLQRRGGMTTGESRSRSYSNGIFKTEKGESRSESRVPLLPPEWMMGLPQDMSVVFFAGKHDPFLVGRSPYWTILRLRGRFDDDPYHLACGGQSTHDS